MQRCPACNLTYPDDAPDFCPNDGTNLVSTAAADDSQPGVVNDGTPLMSNAPSDNQQVKVQHSMMGTLQPHANPLRKWVSFSRITIAVSVLLGLGALIMGVLARGATRSSRGTSPLATAAIMTGVFGGSVLIVGIILFFSLRKQAGKVDEMLAGRNLLVHWVYSPQEWSQYVQSEVTRGKQTQRIVLLIMLITLVIVMIASFTGESKSGGSVLVPIIIAIVMVGGIGLFVWWISSADVRRKKRQHTGEVFIAATGLLFNDRYYPWNTFGTRLTGVLYEGGIPNVVRFKYQQRNGQNVGWSNMEVRVPVPIGREVEAQNLAAQFPR